jgi:hypothetical protein
MAAAHLARTYRTNVSWAIAGRNPEALRRVLDGLCEKYGEELRNHIGTLIADSNECVLKRLAARLPG